MQYTDFTAYAALLSGAAPPTLHQSVVARHPQTWKLREYHLLAPEPSAHAPRRGRGHDGSRNSHADAGNGGDVSKNEDEDEDEGKGEDEGEGDGEGDGEGGDDDAHRPLSIGDPLRAFFPPGVDIQLTGDAALVREPTRASVSRYEAARAHGGGHEGGHAAGEYADAEEEKEYARRVREVLVVGEVSAPASSRVRVRVVLTVWLFIRPFARSRVRMCAYTRACVYIQGHSSWGVFNLLGRIRPGDGFISISKEYVRAPPPFLPMFFMCSRAGRRRPRAVALPRLPRRRPAREPRRALARYAQPDRRRWVRGLLLHGSARGWGGRRCGRERGRRAVGAQVTRRARGTRSSICFFSLWEFFFESLWLWPVSVDFFFWLLGPALLCTDGHMCKYYIYVRMARILIW